MVIYAENNIRLYWGPQWVRWTVHFTNGRWRRSLRGLFLPCPEGRGVKLHLWTLDILKIIWVVVQRKTKWKFHLPRFDKPRGSVSLTSDDIFSGLCVSMGMERFTIINMNKCEWKSVFTLAYAGFMLLCWDFTILSLYNSVLLLYSYSTKPLVGSQVYMPPCYASVPPFSTNSSASLRNELDWNLAYTNWVGAARCWTAFYRDPETLEDVGDGLYDDGTEGVAVPVKKLRCHQADQSGFLHSVSPWHVGAYFGNR